MQSRENAELGRKMPFTISVHSEMVDCGSDQGRSDFATAGVAALRRGLQSRENAELGRKMPFLNGHYLRRICLDLSPQTKTRIHSKPNSSSAVSLARIFFTRAGLT